MPFKTLSRLARARSQYSSPRSWLLSSYYQLQFLRPRSLPWSGKGRQAIGLKGRGRFFLRPRSSDWAVFNSIFFEGEYGFLLEQDLGEVKHVVDLGANIGMFCRWFQQKFPDCQIIAVEPDEANFASLLLNMRTRVSRRGRSPNPTKPNVYLKSCVVAFHRAVQLNRGQEAWSYSLQEASTAPEGELTATITMAEILASHLPPGAEIDLLKCDIEGSEAELFGECSGWIDRVRWIVVETHSPYLPEHFLRDLRANGGHFRTVKQVDIGWGLFVLLLERCPRAEDAEDN